MVISKNISEDDLIDLLLKIKKEELKNSDHRFPKGYSFVQNTFPQYYSTAFDDADKMLYADKKSKKHRKVKSFLCFWVYRLGYVT